MTHSHFTKMDLWHCFYDTLCFTMTLFFYYDTLYFYYDTFYYDAQYFYYDTLNTANSDQNQRHTMVLHVKNSMLLIWPAMLFPWHIMLLLCDTVLLDG